MPSRNRPTAREARFRRAMSRAADPSLPWPARATLARIATATAEHLGLIDRPPACEWCRKRRHRLQRHHWDYARPLVVSFLCPDCHALADAMKAADDRAA